MSSDFSDINSSVDSPFPSQPDPADLKRMIDEAVAAAEAAKRGPAVKPIHCASCYDFTINYSSNGVCTGCSSRGLPPAPDYVLCRRLGFPKGIFYPGIANTLALLTKDYWEEEYTVSALLDETKTTFEQLADLFDEANRVNGKLAYNRAATAAERSAKETEFAEKQVRDLRRSLLSQKNGLVKQLEDFNTRLDTINEKLEALGADAE